jgi:hypothetical protein
MAKEAAELEVVCERLQLETRSGKVRLRRVPPAWCAVRGARCGGRAELHCLTAQIAVDHAAKELGDAKVAEERYRSGAT